MILKKGNIHQGVTITLLYKVNPNKRMGNQGVSLVKIEGMTKDSELNGHFPKPMSIV